MSKRPDLTKRSRNAKTTRYRKGFRVDFGVVSQHKQSPELDAIRIKPGRGGIDLTRRTALAKRIALQGFDDAMIAKIAGVSVETLDYWKAIHGDLDQAIEDGQTAADAEVVATLHMLATGYDREVEVVAGKDAEKVRYNHYHPPEMSAIKYWLNNRGKKRGWAEKAQIEATGRGGKPLVPKESNRELITSIVKLIRPKADDAPPPSTGKRKK